MFHLQTYHQPNLFTREHSDIYVQCAVPNSHFLLDTRQVESEDIWVPATALSAASFVKERGQGR